MIRRVHPAPSPAGPALLLALACGLAAAPARADDPAPEESVGAGQEEAADEATEAEAALPEVAALAEAHDLTGRETAVLLLDRDAQLRGELSGSPLTVGAGESRVTVPLEDVALIAGGAGVGRPARVYLRTGEVLAGSVNAPDLAFEATSGLRVKLDPATLGLVFAQRAPERDGVPPAGTVALLRTHEGVRLAVTGFAGTALPVATPWGALTIPLERVHRLDYRLEADPPGLWIELLDGARFPAAPLGPALRLEVARRGTLEVDPAVVAGLRRPGAEEPPALDGAAASRAFAGLPGEVRLVGEPAGDLEILLPSGPTPLDLARVARLERPDPERAAVRVTLRSGGALQGPLRAALLPLETPAGTLRVPTYQLLELAIAAPPEPEPAPDAGDRGHSDAAPDAIPPSPAAGKEESF